MNTLKGFTQATQEMKDALVVAKEFRENYDGPDRQNRIWEVFDALISLIGSDESQPYFEANKTDELTYDKDELVEEMSKLHNLPDSFRVDTFINRLDERLGELKQIIKDHAKRLNKNVYPTIHVDRTSGGKGKRTRYTIRPATLDTQTQNDKINEPKYFKENHTIVSYEIESELPKLPIWARWLFPVINRKWLVVTLGVSPFIAFIFICLLRLSDTLFTVNLSPLLYLVPLVYIGCYWLFFRFFTVVLSNNICMLPEVFLPLRLERAVLEVELNPPKSNLPLKKAVKLKVYRATCPVCGHRVNLEKRAFYSNDIIGVCTANPKMHRYSFDFTIRSGVLLSG